MNVESLIFDMDGLLLETETIAIQAFEEVCTEFGIEMQKEVYYRCIGTNEKRSREILMEGFGKGFPYEKVFKLWGEIYKSRAVEQPVPLKKGVVALLSVLNKKNIPTAVATSTVYEIAVKKLKNAGIFDYFNKIVSGDMVLQSKPHPEIYLTAAAAIGIKPENCIALEDSETGVRAALAAGMRVFQIPDLIQPSKEFRKLGHTVIDSLEALIPLLAL